MKNARFLTHPLFCVLFPGLLVTASASAAIVVETYTSRLAFETRLGTFATIDFDDIATVGDTPSSFASDRYLVSHGLTLTGAAGSQFVSRTFEYPVDFAAPSAPNTYAPGPIGGDDNATDVAFFTSSSSPGLVAGFGLDFVDVDFVSGLSGITVFDSLTAVLAAEFVPVAGNGSVQFLGFVTVDAGTNLPIPGIASAHFVTGGGWPSTNSIDGVSVDNLTIGVAAPIPEPAAYAALVGAGALALVLGMARRSRSSVRVGN